MQSSFTNRSLTAAIAAVNNASQAVVCLTNEGNSSAVMSLSLSGLLPNQLYSIGVWEASASDLTQTVRQSSLVTTDPAIPTSSSTIHATASITPTPSLAIPSIIALASPSPLTARTT
ncbi:MAG: hypothetical protein WDW38_000096 [Sanguina aurantia]